MVSTNQDLGGIFEHASNLPPNPSPIIVHDFIESLAARLHETKSFIAIQDLQPAPGQEIPPFTQFEVIEDGDLHGVHNRLSVFIPEAGSSGTNKDIHLDGTILKGRLVKGGIVRISTFCPDEVHFPPILSVNSYYPSEAIFPEDMEVPAVIRGDSFYNSKLHDQSLYLCSQAEESVKDFESRLAQMQNPNFNFKASTDLKKDFY